MKNKSSIEKLDSQINMLSKKEFKEKTRINNVKKQRTTPRKVILEEPTIVADDSLMADLISNDENTKVYFRTIDETIKKDNTIVKKIDVPKRKTLDYEKIYDVYLPILVLILIIIFLVLLIFI